MTPGSFQGRGFDAHMPKFNLHSFAASRPRRSGKRGGEGDERGRHVTARRDSHKGVEESEHTGEKPLVEGKTPVLFRENDRVTERQRQPCLQEVQNYSSSRGKGKKKEKGVKGRADRVSVGKAGGMARRETEQRDKTGEMSSNRNEPGSAF